ncbi:hypothetical protein P8C59_000156 [Phyllachora maydis]|uniref:RNA helicase n=1 Tax=Phyllachora maydis TaxID=1825666 RepID=A0AAD9HX26_9PEZI|nr:hypothetical protein P8C59_000156 [Phyllachora maydis]
MLSIAKHRHALLYLIENHPVTIVVAETSAGKSTQIPQYLEDAGWCTDDKLIGITQPRRVAATTLATRVAEEVGCEVGTRHSTDILLGLLKKIRRKRPELRIVISSATLQAEQFRAFFAEGAQSPTENYFKKAIHTVLAIHKDEPDGDILVFFTGREEIEQAVQEVSERSLHITQPSRQLLPLPLYAGLSAEQQMYVFEPAPASHRKVIFATNIAEASVTIDGVVYVVDCGFVKLRAYNPKTGIEALTAIPISKTSAAQRTGRAGRTRSGKCFRLYTEGAFQSLPEESVPEIQRTNLAPFILQLKALGIDNVLRFNFFSPPPPEQMSRALELLYSLGALDDFAKLTRPLGLRMAELAVEPMMAKTLLSAPDFGCLGEMLTIAAMTSLGINVWIQHEGEKKKFESTRRRFAVEEGDHLTLLNAFEAFIGIGRKESRFCHENLLDFKAMTRAVSIRGQLKRYVERFGITVDDRAAKPKSGAHSNGENIRRCLTAGYFAHAAKMQADGTFRNVSGSIVLHAHPSSLMFNRKADWVIFHEIMETSGKTYIRDITNIEKAWLLEYAPGFFQPMS